MKKILTVLAGIFVLFVLCMALMWSCRKPILKTIAEKAFEALRQDLGRELSMAESDITSDGGIELKKLCVSQKPDFSKGKFFCADRVLAIPEVGSDNKSISIKLLELENAEIYAKEENGHWDFEDLTNGTNSSSSDSNFEDTWIISRLVIRNSRLYINFVDRNISVDADNADLELNHKGKAFTLEGKANITAETQKALAKLPLSVKLKTEFRNGKTAEASGKLELNKLAFGKITLEKLSVDTNLYGLDLPVAEKNYVARIDAHGIVIPADDNLIYEKVPQYLKIFAAAVGKPAPVIKNAEFHSIKGHFQLERNSIEMQQFSLRSNFMEMDGDMKINGKGNSTSAAVKLAIGRNDIKLLVSGPIKKPELKPVLAETLSRKLKEAYVDLENSMLEYFPVNRQ